MSSANGLRAVELALRRLQEGADPLDAAVAGVNLVEDDPADMTVGYGGVPNEEGVVQLDACVMHGPSGRAGAVAALEGVKNPTKVAKLVMETTDHVLLVGPGARHFATVNGFGNENLLTEKARKVWLFWKQNLSDKDKWLEPEPDRYPPEVKEFIEQFGWDDFRRPQGGGTIHLSAVDARGDLAGCTSTSGLFFKMPGRVGDSPIIGAGCFTDNEVGSAGGTGRGEANILVSGGHLIVELMRQGKHPREACLMALERIARTTREKRLLFANGRPKFDISFYALDKAGRYGSAVMYAFSTIGKRRQFAVADASGARKEDCAFLFERR
ncbi:MAG: N(4)-(beta-N-acetylglucosaminyl)-L-asparaginase [Deltaproteobacteria bacterium]|nr:MAG: N(4)-(beta-N-acetylglucosaminyl)-L-asparaginase [Deltaproteobacteria bacterium]TMB27542.1 MAG: N(4)-(beta-N-acetylglucosaminyl)-L-asparaginase [Deltaproteobacteria bacterium]